ncbi:MAG TPA: inorganic phosphate transporter [Actinomycetota bacterium]|nr:inorganic phosphate transporter [Actinomycetota bacterium]
MNPAGALLIAMALAFDFANGWHDSANSIATVVSTGVLSPKVAVLWAAFFNFVAFLIFGVAVAKTIASIINPAVASDAVIFAALLGAIAWDVITWYFGLPTSSSHALVGGLVGAGVARAGWHVVDAAALWKTVEFIFLSPIIGLILGMVFIVLIYRVMRRATPRFANKLFRRGQLFSAGALSLGHGANDAQKTMGVIAVVLLARHDISSLNAIPLWVVLAANGAIALGTASGGWRIVRTMGRRITNLVPVQGFAAETAAAITLFVTSVFGIPVSTTHTITGAIVGVGSTRRLSAVRWGVAGRVVWAWFLTIPLAAAMAAIALEVLTRLR